jgi:hypothetical protein
VNHPENAAGTLPRAPARRQLLGGALTRLVACQGSAQLLTAAAAVECQEASTDPDWRSDHNILVIHDLYSPAEGEFDRTIRELAAHLAPWKQIVTLSSDRLRGLKSLCSGRGVEAAIRELMATIGVDRADSIYLCRNWQFGSELLLNAYQASEKVCYGDGIGIYSGRRTPPPASGSKWWSGAVQGIRSAKRSLQKAAAALLYGARQTELLPVEFDVGYLAEVASPAIDGRPPMPTQRVDARWQRNILERLGVSEFSGLGALREAIHGRNCLVLMGESLSEGGVATLAAEIALYGEIVRRCAPPPGTLLLYKPHPRDNPQKVRQIAASLTHIAPDVLTLSGGSIPFLPFELLFAGVFREHFAAGKLQVWTTGFTAMALKHLFGVTVNFGMGDDLIRRYVAPQHVAHRIELERYMRNYLTQEQAATPRAA